MFTEATYETAQTVNDHLSSVDAWFEEVISGNQASATGPGSVTEIVGKRSKSIGEDYVARSSLLKTLPDLSALTNELQTVCEASPQANDQPNCRTDEHLAKGTDHHDANVNTNSVMEDQQESTFEGKEAVTIQNTKASSEVVQLRKIVVKLKEALDSKDDMLLILDGKVKSLELLASK
ncbi:hypothetical protein PRIC1_007448 [Phytophthora ramorum]|uniref:uncharacterized protein n=1 Tax=Phytophthora ramorum TaxID=164328 RepID=UPI0030A8A95A|nr:hypothetical protein KRP23_2384 [Phytophthora ramorum]KAH7502289.1 hypothetical protein KRP22_7758 [Phytophthora ramorum]